MTRLSKQACRLLAILDALHSGAEKPVSDILGAVHSALPDQAAVCDRTLRRDLDAMHRMGWLERTERTDAPRYWYRLAPDKRRRKAPCARSGANAPWPKGKPRHTPPPDWPALRRRVEVLMQGGRTIAELAQAIGVHRSTASRWFRATSDPALSHPSLAAVEAMRKWVERAQ